MIPVSARVVGGLARIEAWRLSRSVLVLAGLVAGGLLVWIFGDRTQPTWWNGGWAIGYGQAVVSAAALVAAQLAVGRARRDGLARLYESFPSSFGRRTLAHLIGQLGALPAGLVLIGATSAVFEAQGVVGTPDPATLVGGLLLVLAGGAIGVALGTRFSHPLAGVIGGFAWFVPFSQSNRWSGPATWLFPWVKPENLGELPGPLSGYPPALAHAAELAAIAALAGAVALAVTTAARHGRLGLLAAAALALAAIVVTGTVQARPVPTRDLDLLVSQAANTGSARHCTASGEVDYCLFSDFGARAGVLQGPVDAVLAHVPARVSAQHARALTIAQFTQLFFDDTTLTHGHSQQLADWADQLQSAPANLPSSSALYVNLGSWPTGGQAAADARFALAIGVAEWAVGLPTNTGTGDGVGNGQLPPQCVPLNQAREAVAIWLAAQGATLPPAPFQGRVNGVFGDDFAQVAGTTIVTWSYLGQDAGYDNFLASPGPQDTAAGYLLAQAMTRLPTARVASVLAAGWGTWTSPHTTDAQLAAGLGITMPAVPSGLTGPHGQLLTMPPGMVSSLPECTS